ncbi:hypothetical protein BZA05DRAFT_122361 [Tricharina praecox]|uniref:uncharacterized protein n=1 Tax=Tricharina praecox TaxID=43433 RepID=UPI002220A302|nr:uncharacterized protein BZA05DRAFT_122361 [Tricharina praecox]KAI5848203.1 hypothetical protein BZA05DRAFT_122361 [Tricharina praecox]
MLRPARPPPHSTRYSTARVYDWSILLEYTPRMCGRTDVNSGSRTCREMVSDFRSSGLELSGLQHPSIRSRKPDCGHRPWTARSAVGICAYALYVRRVCFVYYATSFLATSCIYISLALSLFHSSGEGGRREGGGGREKTVRVESGVSRGSRKCRVLGCVCVRVCVGC